MVMARGLERRVEALEEVSPELPFLVVKQDLDDRSCYHGFDGKTYRESELEELALSRELVRIVYVDDWRGPEEGLIYGDGA